MKRIARQQWLFLVGFWPWILTLFVTRLVEDGFTMWRLYLVVLSATVFALSFANEVVRWLR